MVVRNPSNLTPTTEPTFAALLSTIDQLDDSTRQELFAALLLRHVRPNERNDFLEFATLLFEETTKKERLTGAEQPCSLAEFRQGIDFATQELAKYLQTP